jgi:hypothetical protein
MKRMEQRNYEIVIEVSKLEAKIFDLHREISKKECQIECC